MDPALLGHILHCLQHGGITGVFIGDGKRQLLSVLFHISVAVGIFITGFRQQSCRCFRIVLLLLQFIITVRSRCRIRSSCLAHAAAQNACQRVVINAGDNGFSDVEILQHFISVVKYQDPGTGSLCVVNHKLIICFEDRNVCPGHTLHDVHFS